MLFATMPYSWLFYGALSLLLSGYFLKDIFTDDDEPVTRSDALEALGILLVAAIATFIGHAYGFLDYFLFLVGSALLLFVGSLIFTAIYPPKPESRMRVKFLDGSTGTIDTEDFDPENMEKL